MSETINEICFSILFLIFGIFSIAGGTQSIINNPDTIGVSIGLALYSVATILLNKVWEIWGTIGGTLNKTGATNMKDKICIKRKHVFSGSLLAYPIGYILYSWYYWFTHLHLVEQTRFFLLTNYGYAETSIWNYISYPFRESTGAQEAVFVLSVIWIVVWGLVIMLSRIYSSEFMNKCVVKRK